MTVNYHIEISGNISKRGNKLKIMILASQFGIKGCVSEKANKIEIDAESDAENLTDFIEACRKKFFSEMTKEMIITRQSPAYYDEFSIH
jgi:acylphosphatase